MTGTVTDSSVRLLGLSLRRDDAEALRCGDRAWSWAQLNERADRFAAAGSRASRRLAVLDMNDPATIEAAYGASRAGAVLTVVNFRLGAGGAGVRPVRLGVGAAAGGRGVRRRRGWAARAAAAAARGRGGGGGVRGVARDRGSRLAAQSAADLPTPEPGRSGAAAVHVWDDRLPEGRDAHPPRRSPRTTPPRCRSSTPSPDTSRWSPMPLYHVGGLAYALSQPRRRRPDGHRPRAGAVGAAGRDRGAGDHRHVHRAGAAGGDPGRPDAAVGDLSRLRHVLYGASPMPAPLMRACLARFPGVLGQVYGMTELSGAVTYLSPEDHADAAHPERLMSAGGRTRAWRRGWWTRHGGTCAGRARASCGCGRRSGWRATGASRRRRPRRWWRTAGCGPGDVARIDAEGFVYLEDRVKDLIISGGENVYPAEVERVLAEHPSVGRGGRDRGAGREVGGDGEGVRGAGAGGDRDAGRAGGAVAGAPGGVQAADVGGRAGGAAAERDGKILRKDLRAPYWEGRERRV